MSFLLIFLAGVCEGYMDVLQFHYSKFEKKHKKADRLFWDAEISWTNKYDKDFNPRFWGSTTFFVSLTDGWHLMKMLRNVALFSGIGFAVYWTLDLNVFIFCTCSYILNRLGFNLIYKIIYK